MRKRATLVIVIPLLCLLMSLLSANAAEITSCVLDNEVYLQGQSGYVKVDVYNNLDDKIRVTQVTMVIDYFYTDGTVYRQTWYANSTLPTEIPVAESSTFYIPFTLPNNIASGYTRLIVRVWTDLWNTQAQRWYMSDNPTAETILYIESPYKQLFEQEQSLNAELQEDVAGLEAQIDQLESSNVQLEEDIAELESTKVELQGQITDLRSQLDALQANYYTTTMLMYVFIAAAVSLALMMVFLRRFPRRTPLGAPMTQ